MIAPTKITSPQDDSLRLLSNQLETLSNQHDDLWPGEQLALCGQCGVFEWFLPVEWRGQAWSEIDLVKGYLAISEACLTTAFVITQRTAGCNRIAASGNTELKNRLLPDLASGKTLATVAISHLTTSRQHLKKPILTATQTADGFELNGFSPWVTGADHADYIITGATCVGDNATANTSGQQILLAVPRELTGVSTPQRHELVGLSGSHTGPVRFENVRVEQCWIVDGPTDDVMGRNRGASTGGLQTSTLAVGLASAAINFLRTENERRRDLTEVTESLNNELNSIRESLWELAAGTGSCTKEDVRIRANSLVLRATQAALTAAKGTGYVAGHAAGRWCREALFFLVWSCPQSVAAANLCELAGIAD